MSILSSASGITCKLGENEIEIYKLLQFIIVENKSTEVFSCYD